MGKAGTRPPWQWPYYLHSPGDQLGTPGPGRQLWCRSRNVGFAGFGFTFTLTNDGLSVSSSVQRGYNLLTITEFMKTLEKCKLKKKTPEVLMVPDLLVQYSRYTDEETGHRKDVTSDDTVGCGQTCWESCSVVSYEGMCNCPMSSASA